MAKKRIKAFGEWVEDHLRRACGALSPDKRIIVILTPVSYTHLTLPTSDLV